MMTRAAPVASYVSSLTPNLCLATSEIKSSCSNYDSMLTIWQKSETE